MGGMPIDKFARRTRAQARLPWPQRPSPETREALSVVLSALLIGIIVGFAAVGFDIMVHTTGSLVHRARVMLGNLWGPLVVMLVPAAGGILVAPIVVRLAPEVRGSGIPAVMLAASNFGGRISKRIALWRPVASTLSIGTGASLGTEGPVVQMGGSLASLVADGLKLTDERRRDLVAVASASGIAATFNAPIAGVLFALEVVLGQFGSRYFASVVIGAVAASAVSRSILGADPAFAVPELYRLNSPFELLWYMLLGLVCASVAVAFIRLVVRGDDLFNWATGDRPAKISPWLRPALGGLLVGAMALFLPQILGRGYDTTGAMLAGEVTGLGFLLALLLIKALATSVSLASWASGGVFAPLLFIGAATGAAFAQVANQFGAGVATGAFALVGMGAVFTGATRAPISTIVMMLELSDGYALILPLLLAAVIANLLADALHPESIYQLVLSRRGLSLLRHREHDLLQTVTVREVMQPQVPTIPADSNLADLETALAGSHHHGFVVTTAAKPDSIAGIVTLSDLDSAKFKGAPPRTPVLDIAQVDVHCALPDEPISAVLERMGSLRIGRMPVVDPANRRLAIGLVEQSDLARAYYQALQRQRQLEEDARARRIRDLTGQEIVELKVRRDSPLAGVSLSEAQLPKDSIVVAIRRRGKTLFPHGDTTLAVGDVVVACVAPGLSRRFREQFEDRRAGNS